MGNPEVGPHSRLAGTG